MPGWIIQGVRGEGKSLCAVGRAVQYLERGCPVATNLDLFLDNLLPAENSTLAYRLPDHPRLEDFEVLPPAYDVSYKGEDKNGLLILDELGTWLNSRSWSDKGRLKMLNWLFLSRKNHWDIILLAQDHEMIDSQVRTTLCDYLVQASRLDRQRIPYLSGVLKFLGINSFMPNLHVYHVFYGMSFQAAPVEIWRFRGKNLYSGYDTNQRFRDGFEPLNGTLVDMRAVFTYLPANYLTGNIYVSRFQEKISVINSLYKKGGLDTMAKPKAVNSDSTKAIFLSLFLLIFLGYRFFSGSFLPSFGSKTASASASVLPVASALPVPSSSSVVPVAPQDSGGFFASLLEFGNPFLSSTIFDSQRGFSGFLKFRDKKSDALLDSVNISELHALDAFLIPRPYGADLVYRGRTYFVRYDSGVKNEKAVN